MLEIKSRLKMRRGAYGVEVKGRLAAPFATRRGQTRARLDSGEEVAIRLPDGEALRGGDLAVTSDGRVIEVAALPEKLIGARFADAAGLARAAFRLGSRHVPVEFAEGGLRVAAAKEVEELLTGMGATLAALEAPFEPEVEPHDHGRAHHDHDHDHADCDHPHHHPHR